MPSPERPRPDEYRADFEPYVSRVPETDLLPALAAQGEAWRAWLAAAPEELGDHTYAPGKWTVRQVVAHVIDAELVFAYRALAIARGDTQPLPAFDEVEYAARAGFDPATLAALGAQFALLRGSNHLLLSRFEPGIWLRRGTAGGKAITVRALAYVMVGHARHHAAVLAERYAVAGVPAA